MTFGMCDRPPKTIASKPQDTADDTLCDIKSFADVIKLRMLGGEVILDHLLGPKGNHMYHYKMEAEGDVIQERRSCESKRDALGLYVRPEERPAAE